MEEELFEFVIDDNEFDTHVEIDQTCEFDAPRFFDFTRPESHWDAAEAESWFEFAAPHAPSPFALKLKSRIDMMMMADQNPYCDRHDSTIRETSTCCDDIRANSETQYSLEDGTKARLKPSPAFRSSTLMKPTASHLAKQNQCREAHSNRVMRRHQKLHAKNDVKASLKSHAIDGLATKRQKLKAGYVRKVAHLKHQTVFSHKPPKKIIDSSSRVTIPKEPNLETAQRALRRRSKLHPIVDGQAKSNIRTFIAARPLNRKIFHAPISASNKKSAPHLPDFQVFQLRTAERAMHHSSNNSANIGNCVSPSQDVTADFRRDDSATGLKEEKSEDVHKLRSRWSKKEYAVDKRISNIPLADSFSKLSLASVTQANTRSHSKLLPPVNGFKENTLSSFHSENVEMVKEKPKKVGANQYHCGIGRKIHDIGSALNLNRSVNIH